MARCCISPIHINGAVEYLNHAGIKDYCTRSRQSQGSNLNLAKNCWRTTITSLSVSLEDEAADGLTYFSLIIDLVQVVMSETRHAQIRQMISSDLDGCLTCTSDVVPAQSLQALLP